MACETFEETINGALYVTTQWPASKQMLMKMKLASVFGSSLFQLVQGMSTKGDDKEGAQLAAFENAIASLFEKTSPEKLVETLKELLTSGSTKREGKRITPETFDAVYNDAGLAEMYRACLFVIKSNYADFFKGQKAGELLAKVEEKL